MPTRSASKEKAEVSQKVAETPPNKFTLFAALHEESRAGWVWISPGDSPDVRFIGI